MQMGSSLGSRDGKGHGANVSLATWAGGSLTQKVHPLVPALLDPVDVSLQLFSHEVTFANRGPVC